MRIVLPTLLVTLQGCGGDDLARPTFEGVFGAPDVPPAARPAMGACPTDWSEQSRDGFTRCEPESDDAFGALSPWDCPVDWDLRDDDGHPGFCSPPEPDAECGPGEVAFLGATDCAPVGSECPAFTFPDETLSDPASLFVSPGSWSGDGTPEAPFGTIAEALLFAGPDSVIVLSAGSYAERVDVSGQVTIRGACASGTEIVGPDAPVEDAAEGTFLGTVHVEAGAALTLRDVAITGPRTAITVVEGRLDAVDVWIHDVTHAAIRAEGAGVDVSHVLIENVASADVTGNVTGRGLDLRLGTSAFVDAVEVRDPYLLGILARDEETQVEVSRAVVRRAAIAMSASIGAHLAVSEFLVTDSGKIALQASDEGTHLDVVDGRIRDTEVVHDPDAFPALRGEFGMALSGDEGASVTASRLYVTGSRAAAIMAFSDLTLDDIVITDTRAAEKLEGGLALQVSKGTTRLTRALLSRTVETSVSVDGPGVLEMRDAVVRENFLGEATTGAALSVRAGGSALLDAVRVEESDVGGILAIGSGTTLTGLNLVVRGIRASVVEGEETPFAVAVSAFGGASVTLDAALVEESEGVALASADGGYLEGQHVLVRNQVPKEGGFAVGAFCAGDGSVLSLRQSALRAIAGVGVAALSGGALDASDVWVDDVGDTSSAMGIGMGAQLGGTVRAERVAVTQAVGGGIASQDEGTVVTGTDVFVDSILPTRDDTFGWGALALLGGELVLDRAEITRVNTAGVFAFGGKVTLSRARVEGVREGNYYGDLISWVIEGVGDGILAVAESTVTVSEVEIVDCDRAAVLYDDSEGSVRDIWTSGALHEVVVQGSSRPSNAQAVPGAAAEKLPVPRTSPPHLDVDAVFSRLTRGSGSGSVKGGR